VKVSTTVFGLLVLFVTSADAAEIDPNSGADSAYRIEMPENQFFWEQLSPDKLWSFHRPVRLQEPVLVRGQTPTFDNGTNGTPFYDDGAGGTVVSPNLNGQPYAQPYAQPIVPAQPVDPFLNPQAPLSPMMGPQQIQAFPGVNGPQPYRFGWTLRGEFEYLSNEPVTLNGLPFGSAEIFGINVEAQNAMPVGSSGWVFVHTPNFKWRNVSGIPAPIQFDNLYDFGWDFKLVTPSVGGWGAEVAFEPSINSDLRNSLDGSYGVNLDGRGALLWQWGPQLTWVGGIWYIDRVDDRILPYGGAVWRPNQLWEFRIMYPESLARVFLGNYWGWSHWAYARGEWLHSEAYQIEPSPGIDTQIQYEDIRLTLGWQFDSGSMAGFFEAGWVFDRDFQLHQPLPLGGEIGSGFITRAGVRF
jgi:hypothetical protein